MAETIDIEGWQKDYAALQERWDEELGPFLNQFVNKTEPMVPVSQVLHYIRVLLENEETLEVMKRVAKWDELLETKGPFEDDAPEMALYPTDDVIYLNDFWIWFCWKAGYAPVGFVFSMFAVDTASEILRGELPEFDPVETGKHLLAEYSHRLIPDSEEDLK